MQKSISLFYCFLFFIFSANAQIAVTSHVQQYTTENGLPSNGIKGLQWDEKTNFLWLATEAGIVRFNGVDFRSFTRENTESIVSERMLFMTSNFQKKIYISDLSGNLFSINQSKPELWRKSPGNINPYTGNYYLLPVSDKFFHQHEQVNQTIRFSVITDNVLAINDTTCIIKHINKLYYNSISLKDAILFPTLNNTITQLFQIDSNCFFTNNKGENFLISPKSNQIKSIAIVDENGKPFNSLINPNNFYWEAGMMHPILIEHKNAWLCTYENDKILVHLISTNIPPDALIRFVQYSEKNKTLFIGTDSKGLFILNQTTVESKKRNNTNSKNRNSYYSQIELSNGNVLTNEGDVIGDNSLTAILPFKTKFSFHVSTTSDSIVWYSENSNKFGKNLLHQYNTKTGSNKIYEKLLGDFVVTQSGSEIYLANGFGIGKLEADSMRFLIKYPAHSERTITFAIAEIRPGILGIATCSGLLTLNIATNQLDTILSKPNACVRNIWKYKDYVFLGTYGSGFYIWKDGKLKEMPLDKSKYLQYTHCFVADNEGYCWISTNRGLFKSSLAELIQVFETNTNTVYYHYFGRKDGMEMTELNGGCTPCALLLKNNTISFPTMDGLLWVNPKTAVPVLPEGEIFIDEVSVDNTIIEPTYLTQKGLPASTKEINIKLAFSAWCNKENIYLEYQLNDTLNWKAVNLDNQSQIQFSNLSPGKYTLRIRKLNGFGFNNYTYKKIQFTIITPWYNQWWFYLLCCLAMLGLIAVYLKFRTKQYALRQTKLEQQIDDKTKELQQQNEMLEKNNTIKTKLISIISHDIVTPLKFVTVAGKNLLEKRKLMTEELQQETIQEITNTSQELQLLSTNILNWIKYQNENRRMVQEKFYVHELVNQVLSILNSLAKQKNLQLVNNVDTNLQVHQYFEPLKILIYNLLTNAIHFTEAGKIIISNTVTENKNIITVTDNGSGMSKEQIQNIVEDRFIISSANVDNKKGHGLGYMIIKDLIKTMEASIHIESEKNKGTAVSIILPIQQ
jgi:signal transduction histidine kinase